MAVKREWKIDEARAGHGYFHQYNADGTRLITAQFRVILHVKLANDPSRDVYRDMTADEADALADALREEAAKIRRLNSDVLNAVVSDEPEKRAGYVNGKWSCPCGACDHHSCLCEPESKPEPKTLGDVVLNEIPAYGTPGRNGVTVEQIAERTGRSVELVADVVKTLTENGELHGFGNPEWSKGYDGLRYVKTENATF